MNDQISADLQRLIGRVWIAAYEAGKREALEPKDPDTMRREALAAALAQDGADARVVGDWTAVGDGRVTEFPIPAAGESDAPANVTPIRRADVQLKVGDVVVTRCGGAGKVTDIEDESCQPAWVELGRYRQTCYTSDGFYWPSCDPDDDDIVTLNGRPIIDSEEA